MGSPYVLIKAYSARATDAIGKEHRASRRQGFMRARGGATQKPSDGRFGGELTSHCYSDGDASAPTAVLRRVANKPAGVDPNPTFKHRQRSVHFGKTGS
jgi:hypothetical protein